MKKEEISKKKEELLKAIEELEQEEENQSNEEKLLLNAIEQNKKLAQILKEQLWKLEVNIKRVLIGVVCTFIIVVGFVFWILLA